MTILDALDWRPSPRSLIFAGLVTLVLILAIGGSWFWYSARQERAQTVHAEALASTATARGAQPTTTSTAAIQMLESALAREPGAALAGQSAYELGNLRFDAGDYPAARAGYEIALAKAGSATIRTLARAGIAATWEAQKEFAKAVDAYTTAVAGEKAGQFYYEDLLLSLGRNQEFAGQRDAAIATYKRLLKDVPKLRRESEVRGRLASLGAAG